MTEEGGTDGETITLRVKDQTGDEMFFKVHKDMHTFHSLLSLLRLKHHIYSMHRLKRLQKWRRSWMHMLLGEV